MQEKFGKIESDLRRNIVLKFCSYKVLHVCERNRKSNTEKLESHNSKNPKLYFFEDH